MNKFLTAAAVTLTMAATQVYASDKVVTIDAYHGGFDVVTLGGNFCAMSPDDVGANFVFAQALAAKANGWNVILYNANQAGWGWGSAGGNTCADLTSQ